MTASRNRKAPFFTIFPRTVHTSTQTSLVPFAPLESHAIHLHSSRLETVHVQAIAPNYDA